MWSDDATTFAEMRADVAAFIRDRDWGRYHAPSNVASAMAVEAGELVELFQWRRSGDAVPPEVAEAAGSELADVLHFTLCLANAMEVQLDLDGMTVSQVLAEWGDREPEANAKGCAEEALVGATYTLLAARAIEGRGSAHLSVDEDGAPGGMVTSMEFVVIAIARCARALNLDLASELWRKCRLNEERFPVGSRPDVGY